MDEDAVTRGYCKRGHPYAVYGRQDKHGLACRECQRLRQLERRGYDRNCCEHGHPWTTESTYTGPNGYRTCLICKRARMARWTAINRPVLHDYLPKTPTLAPVWSGEPVWTCWHRYIMREPIQGPRATWYIVRRYFRLNCCLPTIVLATGEHICRVADVVIRTPKPGEPAVGERVFWLR